MLLSVSVTNVYVTVYTRLLLMEDDQSVLTRRAAHRAKRRQYQVIGCESLIKV